MADTTAEEVIEEQETTTTSTSKWKKRRTTITVRVFVYCKMYILNDIFISPFLGSVYIKFIEIRNK